ncbi:ABC transporter ATP-binding protein [Pararobbsia alpina]|uniref:Lipopolysaccharide export system ATP-binding protein LptB n=1 Tax=Pararobbsia alpina TaxID=621374 RepID=A0A6S7BG84_9BURK|nr:ABC transporter ATP-binding protein [Pararobbsia alpina]CAB3799279.1 Lipopolysaccharide export system ATP-binding protein LptB [Pararobbsia alpina]
MSEQTLLAAQGVVKRFGANTVLAGVDFTVRSGEAVGIVGPNGAGKTTLLAALSGSVNVSAGTISLRGQDISMLDAARRCRLGIARSHQVPRPFGGLTVFENVLTAAQQGGGFRREEAYDRSIDAIELCGMMSVANRRAEALGLLDRKRLELTRALATNPELLLLDEIGGGLTDGEAIELVGTIRTLRQRNITIVWIEHIVHLLVQVVERLVCMDAGRVIADGPPNAVLSDAAVVSAYLGGHPA